MKRFVIVWCILFACAGAVRAQQSAIEAADFDGSGRVDFADFLMFAAAFGKSTGQDGFEARFDLNGNGIVDFPDFLIFAQVFGKSPSDPQEVFLYIADLTRNLVEVIDATSNLLDPTRTLYASLPRGIAISETNQRIYVAGVDTFFAFSQSGSAAFKTPLIPILVPGSAPESRGGFRVALSRNHDRAFVTEESGASVHVFNALTGASVQRITVPPTPNGIAMSPDGQRAYVAHGDGATSISVIDAVASTFTDSIPVGQAVTRIVLSPDGERIYCNNARGGALVIANPHTKAIVQTLHLGQEGDANVTILDVAMSPDGSRLSASFNRILFAFDTQGNEILAFWGGVAVFDTATWTKTAEIPVGELVANMGLAPDGKTLYVAGTANLSDQTAEGLQVFIVDLDEAHVLGTIRGLNLPVAFAFRAGKPVVPAHLPELTVF